MRYRVVVEKTRFGYHVSCPALPGCHSQGDTEAEALENIQDAIEIYLRMIRKETCRKHTRLVEAPA